MTSSPTTTATASAVVFHTPKSATRTSAIASQTIVFTARLRMRGCARQRDCDSPTAPSALHHAREIARRTSDAFRCSLAEQSLGTEHEDEDQDREDDRLGPVAAGAVPAQTLVEGLDEADAERAEHGARQVADTAEHGGGERDQAELVARVVTDLPEVEGIDEPAGAGERAGDQERERDRPVDVDPHHRGGVTILSRRAHRLPLSRLLYEPDEREQHRHRDEHDDQLLPRVRHAAGREHVARRQDVRQRRVARALPADRDVLEDER